MSNTKVTEVPQELKHVFNMVHFRGERVEIFNEYEEGLEKAKTAHKFPDNGSFWKNSRTDIVHQVITVAPDSRNAASFLVVHQTIDGVVGTTPLRQWERDVSIYAYGRTEHRVAPAFIPCSAPNEWKWWYRFVEKYVEQYRAFRNRPMSLDEIKAELATDKTGPLHVVNAMKTQHGLANILFMYHRPRVPVIINLSPEVTAYDAKVCTLEATWLPQDITNQMPRDLLRINSEFMRLVTNGHLLVLKPKQAKRILATTEAQEEQTRLTDLDAFVKNVGKARTLEDSNVEIFNSDGEED